MKWFWIGMILMGCMAADSAANAQQKILAKPSVDGKACFVPTANTGSGASRSAPSGNNTAATLTAGEAGPLTAGEKAVCFAREAVSPGAFLWPLFPAGKKMAFPPQYYPPEWRRGAEGLGRNYADSLANTTTNRSAKFLTAILLHEDTRYWPSPDKSVFRRLLNPFIFALVDRSDSGHWTPNIGNLVGSAAGGFIGNAYLPAGYSDVTHAGQRSLVQLAQSPVPYMVCEFTPEMRAAARHIHMGGLSNLILARCAR